jgi:hypothetical protein
MSITALSFSFVSLYASPAAKPATPAERPAAAALAETHACDRQRPGGRENRLAQAMMSALCELGLGGAATAVTGTAAPAPTPAAAATATDASAPAATAATAATAASAVYQFAHELFQALRQDQRGKASSDGEAGRVEGGEGRGHHHHHHDNGYHRGGRREGYGDLSQRLEALSQTFGTPAAAATTGVAQASASAAAAELPTAAPAASSAKNPLLEAFAKLFSALKASAAAGTAASTATTTATSAESDLSGKLRLFLYTLAVALRPDAMAGAQVSQVGGLVNVTA